MELRIERQELPRGGRVLAASDIHGRAGWLERLLAETSFSAADQLFILGDMVEKGPDSLGCLRFCRELSQRENVHILMGNCDTVWEDVLTDRDCNSLHYMLHRKESLLNEMCALLGLPVSPESDYPALRAKMREAFRPELEWLASLPHLIETPEYIFAHAGIRSERLEGHAPWDVMKDDFFYDRCVEGDVRFSKYVIVGHMPTVNYCHSVGDCSPILDRERRVLNLDGGTIRAGGQLNLLVIPEPGSEEFAVYSTDDLPVVTVTEPQAASEGSVHLVWSDPFEILRDEEGAPRQTGEFTLCFSRGKKLLVPSGEIFRYPNGELHCGEATDYLLPVRPGDRVSLIHAYSSRSYCKKDGVLGWISNEKLNFGAAG